MKVGAGTGPELYATAIAGLWVSLSHALQQLDELAAEPDRYLADEAAVESLPGLQYALHAARERVLAIEPPPGAEVAHADLVAALECARDVTACLHETLVSEGLPVARMLVYEWRGALFRVRFTRMRLEQSGHGAAAAEAGEEPGRLGAALLALGVLAAGTAALVTGAVLSVWALWAAGLALVAGACVASAAWDWRRRRF